MMQMTNLLFQGLVNIQKTAHVLLSVLQNSDCNLIFIVSSTVFPFKKALFSIKENCTLPENIQTQQPDPKDLLHQNTSHAHYSSEGLSWFVHYQFTLQWLGKLLSRSTFDRT